MRNGEITFLCLAWIAHGWRAQTFGSKELARLLRAVHPVSAFSHHSPVSRVPVVNPGVTGPQRLLLDSKNREALQASLSRNETLTPSYGTAFVNIRPGHQAPPQMKDARQLKFRGLGPLPQYAADQAALPSQLRRKAEAEPLKADRFEYLWQYTLVNFILLIGVLRSAPAALRALPSVQVRSQPLGALRAPHLRTSQICMSSAAPPGPKEPFTSGAHAETEQPVLGTLRRYLPPLKWFVLLLLIFQNCVTTLLTRQTRQPRADGGLLYLGSAAVLCSEFIKLPVCLCLIARDEGGFRGMVREVRSRVFGRLDDTIRMSVPALCYGLQNVLYYVALSHLSATSYQLWSQSKTLFTALFFVKILGQVLRWPQWFALGLLSTGVGFVQLAERAAPAGSGSVAAAAGSSAYIGVAAVIASSLLAAFANIYFEKVIKTAQCEFDKTCDVEGANLAPMSLWVRNVQLALFSIPQAALLLVLTRSSREMIATHGLLVGFTPAVWLVTMLTASGGLIVGLCVKYADNLLKTYATAVSILATCVITSVTTGVLPSARFIQGMTLVLISLGIYNGVGPLGWWKRSPPENAAEAPSEDKAVEQEK
mmetsp:Transcript_65434/g.123890  ORF Transcript_65434/g.123890 Transcript_65434/m.123890 type:complete len:594 (-) Transcript_65434:84-1865(-)